MNTPSNTSAVAYGQSLALLRRCLTPAGFVASPSDVDNYARVWARDGVIAGLAALASGDAELIDGMGRTLMTLRDHQGPHGEIPSNVTIDGASVSYGRLVGRVDVLFWYVIGVCAYLCATGERSDQFAASVERALFLAGCWEFNERGLIYTPLAGNWADEYIQQGYVLSDQLLYLLALGGAGEMFARPAWQAKAASLRELLVVNYWPRASLADHPLVYHPHAYRRQLEQETIVHWLPSFSPAGYARYFDGLAHALALIADLGDAERQQQTEIYIQSLERQTNSALLPAFWPTIQPGNADWTHLIENHLYGHMKNQPYHYHNGGLWSVLTGLYATGMARRGWLDRARHVLAALDAANAQGRDGAAWEFAEYHHGQSGESLGTPYLAWSAAAAVLAYQSLRGVWVFPRCTLYQENAR